MLFSRLPITVRSPTPVPIENQKSKIEIPSSVLDFIASDESLDRYGEVISAAGWRLDSYLRNPVFQNAHQYGDILFTLGKALITDVRPINGRQVLFQRVQFATDANPMARIAFNLYKDGFLNAVSVGFIPLRWTDPASSPSPSALSAPSPAPSSPPSAPAPSATPSPAPSSVSPVVPQSKIENQKSKILARIYLEQELLEVSAVAIPANPNALALALKAGSIDKSHLRDLADLIHLTLAHPPLLPCPPTPGRAEPPPPPSSSASSAGKIEIPNPRTPTSPPQSQIENPNSKILQPSASVQPEIAVLDAKLALALAIQLRSILR